MSGPVTEASELFISREVEFSGHRDRASSGIRNMVFRREIWKDYREDDDEVPASHIYVFQQGNDDRPDDSTKNVCRRRRVLTRNSGNALHIYRWNRNCTGSYLWWEVERN